jgi:hypothetical protein
MPSDLRKQFFDLYDDKNNDSYVLWGIHDSIYENDQDLNKLIDDWLILNGADGTPETYEKVLIKYWW